jgi:hypothetical protein
MQTSAETIEAAIFSRVFTRKDEALPREVADYFLTLGFSAEDRARMHELAAKNREHGLTADEAA